MTSILMFMRKFSFFKKEEKTLHAFWKHTNSCVSKLFYELEASTA